MRACRNKKDERTQNWDEEMQNEEIQKYGLGTENSGRGRTQPGHCSRRKDTSQTGNVRHNPDGSPRCLPNT